MKFEQVKEYYKTYRAIALALGVTEQTVRNWKDSGIPYLPQLALENLTEGKLKAEKGDLK